jgi:predicted kinase
MGYMNERPLRVIHIMGLPASGKSTISDRLGEKLGAPVLSSEDVRVALYDINPTESDTDFTPEQLDTVYSALEFCLDLQLSYSYGFCIVEGVFRSQEQRKLVTHTVSEHGAQLDAFHIRCDEKTALERLEKRQQTDSTAPAGKTAYKEIREDFAELQADGVIEIDTTDDDVETSVTKILKNIFHTAK